MDTRLEQRHIGVPQKPRENLEELCDLPLKEVERRVKLMLPQWRLKLFLELLDRLRYEKNVPPVIASLRILPKSDQRDNLLDFPEEYQERLFVQMLDFLPETDGIGEKPKEAETPFAQGLQENNTLSDLGEPLSDMDADSPQEKKSPVILEALLEDTEEPVPAPAEKTLQPEEPSTIVERKEKHVRDTKPIRPWRRLKVRKIARLAEKRIGMRDIKRRELHGGWLASEGWVMIGECLGWGMEAQPGMIGKILGDNGYGNKVGLAFDPDCFIKTVNTEFPKISEKSSAFSLHQDQVKQMIGLCKLHARLVDEKRREAIRQEVAETVEWLKKQLEKSTVSPEFLVYTDWNVPAAEQRRDPQ